MKRNCALLALSWLLFFAWAAAQPKPFTTRTPAEQAQGKKLYDNQCALCHGIGGAGGSGPALNQPKLPRATTEAALINIIRGGLPKTEMPGFWMLNEKEMLQVAAYVRTLGQLPATPRKCAATRGAAQRICAGPCSNQTRRCRKAFWW